MAKKKKLDEALAQAGEMRGNLEDIISEIKEKFGDGAIMKLKEVRRTDVDVIPTGSISLDGALGVRGVPRGRVIEIYGGESTGKTTLALHMLSEPKKKEASALLWMLNTPLIRTMPKGSALILTNF